LARFGVVCPLNSRTGTSTYNNKLPFTVYTAWLEIRAHSPGIWPPLGLDLWGDIPVGLFVPCRPKKKKRRKKRRRKKEPCA
jgi:hypothetical protein